MTGKSGPPTSKRAIRGVREDPPGSGVWHVDCYIDGRRYRERCGSKSQAVTTYHLRKTGVPRVGRSGARSSQLLSALADAALADKKQRVAASSYAGDRFRWKPLLKLLGDRPAASLTHQHIQEALRKLRERGVQGPTANRYRSLLSSIFSFGVRNGIVAANPVARVPRYKENPSRVRYLTEDEELALRKVIRAECPERESEIDLALHTGARRGEQFTLTWEKVDLIHGILELNGKTGPRTIEINGVCRQVLAKLYEASNGSRFVCPEAKRSGQRDWRRWFEECVKKAELDDFTWHDLRHTFASRLVMAGVDIRTVQELLGHRNITQTMKYAHLSRNHARRAVEKLESSFPLQAMLFAPPIRSMDTRMDKRQNQKRRRTA